MFWKTEKPPESTDQLPNDFRLVRVDDWREFIHRKFHNIFDVESFVDMGKVSLDFRNSSHTLGANPCVAASFLFKDDATLAGVLHSRGPFLPQDFVTLVQSGAIVGGIVGGSKETYMRNKGIFTAANVIYVPPTDNRAEFAVMAEPSTNSIFYSYEDLPVRQR